MVNLMTERLIIRDARPEDFDEWHRLISNPKAMYYLKEILTYSPEESRENLNMAIDDALNPDLNKYFLAVELIKTGAGFYWFMWIYHRGSHPCWRDCPCRLFLSAGVSWKRLWFRGF